MQKLTLICLQVLLVSSLANGQCPTPGFSLPDSVCTGSGFQVNNTTSGAASVFWDFCPGDMQATPVSSLMPTDPALNFPQQVSMVNDNGQYYLFVINYSSSSILRYDFGTSVDNTPVIFNYGNVSGLISNPAGLDVINDNGTWYALVVNNSANTLIRVDLGSVISANVFSGVNLGTFGLSAPTEIQIARDVADYYAFVTNGSGSIVKVSFGNSLSNTPSGSSTLTDASFGVPWGFEIAYDCSLNSWVGFCASYTLNQISVINFGSTLANTGTVSSTFPCLPSPTGIGLVRDGNSWYVLVNSITSFVLERFERIKLSGNLLSTPSSNVGYIDPQLTSPRSLAIVRVESSFRAFVACNNPNNIVKLVLEQPCSSTPAISNDPFSVNVVSTLVNDYQEIFLEAQSAGGEVAYFSDSIFVLEKPEAGFIKSAACEGSDVIFTDTSLLNSSLTTSWQWDFGDASPVSNDQNPLHTYPGTGTYYVTLTVTYSTGCSDVVTDSVIVNPIPEAEFTYPNNQCANVPVLFTDASQAFGGATIISWSWDFGDASPISTDQNPLHVFTGPGNYTVLLLVETNTGCTDTISKIITIKPSPEAGFNIASTCVGETVSFTNTTIIQGGGSITYNWDFGDTFTSTAVSPNHQYVPNAANYDVTLIATASNGCKDTVIQDIRIANKPVPQFTYSPQVVCKFNPVTFTNTSFGVGGDTISAYFWDFGDTGTSTDENPFHAYSDTGYFNVTLTVVSPTACDSTITQQVYVIPSPTASFTATNVCLGLNTGFNPLTTTPPNTQIDSIVWEFGDGASFTGLTSPTHLYALPGRYGVTMTVYNNLLCTGSFTDSVDVYPIPVASFTSSLACSGSLVDFDGTSSSVTGDTLSTWLWNFDGLGTSGDSITQFAFQDSGSYDVTLIVSTIHGCQDTIVTPVSVIQSPQFDFVFNEPCFGLPSNFTYIPLVLPAPSSVLTWDFGDGTISSQLSPTHTFLTIDTFMVSLTVLHNATGCSAEIQQQLVIKPYPDAGFTFENGCEDLPVLFTDTSLISTGTITAWNWNFGVLGTSTSATPTVLPSTPGDYPISLTVTSNEGCASVIADTLTVFANPVAAFTPDPLYGSPPLIVNFINSTSGGVTYEWDFGDGSSGTGAAVSHIYQDTGLYNITLLTASAEGCLDSVSAFISVLIPYLDIAVNKIFIAEENELLTITAELLNTGNVPVNTFEIAANIQNGSVINESWSGDFQPGDALIYTFNARYDINSKSLPGYYCVETSSPNGETDRNPANNAKCAVLSSVFEVFTVSPNPFTDQFALSFNLPAQGEYEVSIFDMSGRIIYESENLTGKKGFNKLTIPTPNFRKGVYAVVVRYRDEVKTINVMNY